MSYLVCKSGSIGQNDYQSLPKRAVARWLADSLYLRRSTVTRRSGVPRSTEAMMLGSGLKNNAAALEVVCRITYVEEPTRPPER